MQIPVLTPDDEARLRADGGRWPNKFFIVETGDDGAPVKVPVVLGNPTGTCVLEDQRLASPAWANIVAATYGQRAEPDDGELVRDCLLWPPPGAWAQLVDRWPALPQSVTKLIRSKLGWKLDDFVEAPHDYEAPPELVAARARHPRAVLRVALIGVGERRERVGVVVNAPSSASWRIFLAAVRKKDADHWAIVREYAEAVIVAVDGAPSPGALLSRWPGLALTVGWTASGLAGVGADVEMGEW